MSIFDFASKVKKEVRKKSEENAGFIYSAEKAANIVSESVDKGDLAGISDKINELVATEKNKERFVFPRLSYTRWIILALICIALSAIFIRLFIIYAATAFYSSSFRTLGLAVIVVIAGMVFLNIMIIRSAIKEIRFARRYDIYVEFLKYRNVEIIDDLADGAKAERSLVEKDLQKAVKNNLIPQGHFGTDNNIFLVSDDTYNEYMSKQAAYDRYYKELVEERKRVSERSEAIKEILERGQEYIRKIHDSNDIIKDKEISAKLDRMEQVVSMIFHEVDMNPAQAEKLGVFMGYYLPTTEKLLEAYIDIDEKQIKGKSLKKSQNAIDEALDSLNDAFEALLEQFYQEQELDLASEISAMEIIMQQEGLQNYDA